MLKKFSILTIILCLTLIFTSCAGNTKEAKNEDKIKVAVSFNAMKELTSAIGKDKIEILTIIPDGTEPHDFEPKAKDMEVLNTAKLFIYNGLGMETWADKTLKAVNNTNLTAVEASKGAVPITNENADEIKEHGQYDPHLWLSLKGAEIEAKNIKDGLTKIDSSNKDYYEKNYTTFIAQLEELYNKYDSNFKTTSNKSFVTGHAAFAYLCRDFGLKQNSVEDVFAEGEPSAKKLTELTDYCKKNNIKTIFVEDMVSPKVSDTLAKEVGAKVEKIHTIESSEENKDYVQCMEDNLELIYSSLK